MTEALWYLGRGTGVMALVLFTVSLALGIVTRSRRVLPGLPRFAVSAVHRNASIVGLSLLAVHITTLLFDPYAQLRLVDLVLPFAGAYRPLWLGLGTLALDVSIAVFLSSLLRRRIGWKAWRFVHWAAYAMWPLAFFHALGNGSDVGQTWLRIIAALCFLAVVASIAWRVGAGFTVTRAPRVPRMPERPAPGMVRGVPTSSMPVRR